MDDSGGTPRAIINDVTNLQFATPRAVQDITGIDKSAMERLQLLADFSLTLNGVFNDASNQSHATLKTISSATGNRTVSLAVSGQTLANECIGTDYQLSRGNDGALTWSAPFSLSDGTVPTWS